MTSEGESSPPRLSVPLLIVSSVIGLALGLACGSSVDRALGSVLPPLGQFAAGLTSAGVVAVLVGVVTYRELSRRDDPHAHATEPDGRLE